MKVIIVGGGETGRTLAHLLAAEHHTVTLVEKEEVRAKELADDTDALVIKGDGTDINILKDAGIESGDAVVAASNDDKTNLMVCQIAKSQHIGKIIARVNSTGNEELFTKLGISSIVPLVGMTVTAIKRELLGSGERVIAQLGEGDTQVIELTVQEHSKLIGKSPSIKSAAVGTIYRDGELIIPTKSHKLKEGDVLIIIAKSKDLPHIRKHISGS
jgi:trk system potassium uptake protein TrkA